MKPVRLGELPIEVTREAVEPFARWANLPPEPARKRLAELLADATLREAGYYRLRSKSLPAEHPDAGFTGIDISAYAEEEDGRMVVVRITVRGQKKHRGAGRQQRRRQQQGGS